MREYLDFIKFALDEFSKIDGFESINISEFLGQIKGIEFEVWFKRGFKSFKISSEESMEKCLKEQIEKFIKREKELKDLEDKKSYYEKELKHIEEQIKEWRRNE